MQYALLAIVGLAVVAALALLLRGLATDDASESSVDVVRVEGPPWLTWVVPVVAVAVALVVTSTIGLPVWITASIGLLVGAGASIGVTSWRASRIAKLEAQLAEGIDLMVSTLRAGGGLMDAVSTARREVRAPLRDLLLVIVERVRLGDSPRAVLETLQESVPLESFRLFSFTLIAHWEGGGSLASTLSDVGRTIRDRVDVQRRVRSQAVETQASVVGVLVITYGLALLMWNNYPERLDTFATSELGGMAIGTTILLQGIGLLWITRLTRVDI